MTGGSPHPPPAQAGTASSPGSAVPAAISEQVATIREALDGLVTWTDVRHDDAVAALDSLAAALTQAQQQLELYVGYTNEYEPRMRKAEARAQQMEEALREIALGVRTESALEIARRALSPAPQTDETLHIDGCMLPGGHEGPCVQTDET